MSILNSNDCINFKKGASLHTSLFTLLEYLSSPSVISGIRAARSLVFCVEFCRSLFVLLSLFFWPLCFLFLFRLRILITSLWYLHTLFIYCNNKDLCEKPATLISCEFQRCFLLYYADFLIV
jgi:hypothetical protein